MARALRITKQLLEAGREIRRSQNMGTYEPTDKEIKEWLRGLSATERGNIAKGLGSVFKDGKQVRVKSSIEKLRLQQFKDYADYKKNLGEDDNMLSMAQWANVSNINSHYGRDIWAFIESIGGTDFYPGDGSFKDKYGRTANVNDYL